MLQNGLLNL